MPESLNLERLRKEAKALLKRIRAGDVAAIARIRVHLPKLLDLNPSQFALQAKLADIHHALALEHGYSNWAELKRHDSPLERFLAAVRRGSLHSAQDELRSAPELATMSIHAACSIGDVDAVRYHLELDPKSIDARHHGWSPLIYTCASRFHRRNPRHATGIVDCVSLLLDRGADPDSFTVADPSEPEIRIPAVARAQASFNAPVELLLRQRGASVSTGNVSRAMSNALRSLYPQSPLDDALTSTGRADPAFNEEIRRRLAPVKDRFFSSSPDLDKTKEPPSLPLYLTETDLKEVAKGLVEFAQEHGININLAFERDGSTLLHIFARLKDYPDVSTEAVTWLIAHGADPDIPREDGQTPLVLAVRIGNNAAADVMRTHGADIHSVRPLDELMGACRNRDSGRVAEILRRYPGMLANPTPEASELLVSAATVNRTDEVRFLARLGFDLGGIGENGAAALHIAASNGQVEMVQLLLELGTPVNVRDATFGTSPLAWAARASKDFDKEEACCRIVEALLDAGADRATCVNRWGVAPEETCSPRVAAIFQSRGFST
jgi:ankyrin repeat protein